MSPTPPSHLSKARKTFWALIVRDFQLEAQHLELLRLACEQLDRADEARRTLKRDGPYTVNRYGGIVKHPALTVEKDATTLAARILRDLGLPEQTPS